MKLTCEGLWEGSMLLQDSGDKFESKFYDISVKTKK